MFAYMPAIIGRPRCRAKRFGGGPIARSMGGSGPDARSDPGALMTGGALARVHRCAVDRVDQPLTEPLGFGPSRGRLTDRGTSGVDRHRLGEAVGSESRGHGIGGRGLSGRDGSQGLGHGRGVRRSRRALQVVLLDPITERLTAGSEETGGGRDVALDLLQGVADDVGLHVVQG